MGLIGPVSTPSLTKKKYAFVIVDDYSRYTWVMFIQHKNKAFDHFELYCSRVENEKGLKLSRNRSDHGGKFENGQFSEFCTDKGYIQEFSAPRTPQKIE